MKKYLILAIVVLVAVIGTMWQQVQYANVRWERAEANLKDYVSLFDNTEKRNAALQLTISQLNYFKDSVLMELNSTRKELKVKDKDLKALQAVSSSFSRRDTIRVTQTDTLFREPTLAIDTLIGDQWYTMRLGLKYPSMITTEPQFKSEKHIVVSSKKETVDPPKKFFLFRWFQRRHIIVKVDVVEKNPYVDGESSRYVEIIR